MTDEPKIILNILPDSDPEAVECLKGLLSPSLAVRTEGPVLKIEEKEPEIGRSKYLPDGWYWYSWEQWPDMMEVTASGPYGHEVNKVHMVNGNMVRSHLRNEQITGSGDSWEKAIMDCLRNIYMTHLTCGGYRGAP